MMTVDRFNVALMDLKGEVRPEFTRRMFSSCFGHKKTDWQVGFLDELEATYDRRAFERKLYC